MPPKKARKTKKCGKCNKRKAVKEFYRSRQAKDGLQHWCKKCMVKRNTSNRRRKAYLRKNGKSRIDIVSFLNRLHLERVSGQTETDITAEWLVELWESAAQCPMCDRALSKAKGRTTSKQLDHITPIKDGGLHMKDNVRILCRDCNLTR